MKKFRSEGEILAGRIFLINVGTNASHPFCSPIFRDGTFEFVPIPEDRNLEKPHSFNYRDLHSFYDPSNNLEEFIPLKFLDNTAHNDPEFDTFTYGDNCDVNSRAASLKKVERGDFLFFIARLQSWNEGPTEEYGFYLIGYLHVEKIASSIIELPGNDTLDRFSANAHFRRAMSDPMLWDSFWVFAGSSWSKRFQKAVPVNREICDRLFRSADGGKWKWGRKNSPRTDLQVIGSYTRTCRSVIDPLTKEGNERLRILWEWVDRYSGVN